METDSCGRPSPSHMYAAACRNPDHRPTWVVLARRGNRSAFNGYRWTPSAYSSVQCGTGGAVWRTRAAYVATLPDYTPTTVETNP